MENIRRERREAKARSRRFAATSITDGETVLVGFVIIGEAPQMEMLFRQAEARGARIANLRLVCLAAVVADVVNDTLGHVEEVFQRLLVGEIVPEDLRIVRHLGGQLCAMGATDKDRFGFLVPLGKRLVEVCAKAIRMELPHEELRHTVRQVRDEIAAVTSREVKFALRHAVPVADEVAPGTSVMVSSLPDLKTFRERYDAGVSATSDTTIVLTGMVLGQASTAFRLLAGHQGAITNMEALTTLTYLSDYFTHAEADIDHIIGVLDSNHNPNGNAYRFVQNPFVDDQPVSPVERLTRDGEEITRIAQRASFGSLADIGEKMVATALIVGSDLRVSLGYLITDIEKTKRSWLAFPEINIET